MNAIFQTLLEDFISDLDKDGTLARWSQAKYKDLRRHGWHDRAAIMRAAWKYRKEEGLSMSEAMKRAWADDRAEIEQARAEHKLRLAGKQEKPRGKIINFVDYKNRMEACYGA